MRYSQLHASRSTYGHIPTLLDTIHGTLEAVVAHQLIAHSLQALMLRCFDRKYLGAAPAGIAHTAAGGSGPWLLPEVRHNTTFLCHGLSLQQCAYCALIPVNHDVRSASEEFRLQYCRLWKAMVLTDTVRAAR